MKRPILHYQSFFYFFCQELITFSFFFNNFFWKECHHTSVVWPPHILLVYNKDLEKKIIWMANSVEKGFLFFFFELMTFTFKLTQDGHHHALLQDLHGAVVQVVNVLQGIALVYLKQKPLLSSSWFLLLSMLFTKNSSGAQKLVLILRESSFRHPSLAVSKMGRLRISLCRCMDTSPLSSSG